MKCSFMQGFSSVSETTQITTDSCSVWLMSGVQSRIIEKYFCLLDVTHHFKNDLAAHQINQFILYAVTEVAGVTRGTFLDPVKVLFHYCVKLSHQFDLFEEIAIRWHLQCFCTPP